MCIKLRSEGEMMCVFLLKIKKEDKRYTGKKGARGFR